MTKFTKTIKDKDGNDVEVYADNCIVCNREMIFPKKEADYLDGLFPFLREKLQNGSPCIQCFENFQKTSGKSFFSEEEIALIQKVSKDSE